nr:peptidoglycan-binding domain-containing protein [Microbulbifer sediminum]
MPELDENTFVDGVFGPGTEQQVRLFQRNEKLSVDGVIGRNTWSALFANKEPKVCSPVGQTGSTPDRQRAQNANSPRAGGGALAERVLRAVKRKGYKVLDDSNPFHLNIVGVRSHSSQFDNFDDKLFLIYRDEQGRQIAEEFSITTDPGSYYSQKRLLNEDGVAILVPDQYEDTYTLGKHLGKYEALVQRGGKVRVWRDGNRDNRLDRAGKIYEGWYGINIHRARKTGTTERVGRYSAGCQVFQRINDFNILISLANKSAKLRRNRFTYTLLEAADLK